MHYDYFEWFSPPAGLDLGVLRIGHWGPALIYLPTLEGDHREFERFGMEEVARPWIEDGSSPMLHGRMDPIRKSSSGNKMPPSRMKNNW